MPLTAGTRLGPYVLQSLVGAGGMGEVHRPRDASLHRDVKPANIKIEADGAVEVLDFGLAKAADPAHALSGADPVASPTMTWCFLFWIGQVLAIGTLMGVMLRLMR